MNQFRIGHVNIKGNTKTQEKVIRRELYTRPGTTSAAAPSSGASASSPCSITSTRKRSSPTISLVDDKTVDLAYEVEEKSSDNINASVGYSGAFGVTGALGFHDQQLLHRRAALGRCGADPELRVAVRRGVALPDVHTRVHRAVALRHADAARREPVRHAPDLRRYDLRADGRSRSGSAAASGGRTTTSGATGS